MKTLNVLLAACAATSLLFACQPQDKPAPEKPEEKPVEKPDEKEPEKTPSITVNTDETTFTLEAKDEGVSFNVLANFDWTLTKTDLDWAEVTPASGEADDLVTVRIIPQNNPEKVQRQGSFKIAIPGKDCEKAFTVIQAAKGEIKPVTVAKWQFTALWVNEESSAPTNKTNPNAAGASMATAWQNGTPVASNVVPGGYISFVSTSSTAKYTMGPATHKKDRFRAANLNNGDYFLFSLDEIDVAAKDTVRFHNAYLQIANVNKGPGHFAVEWSHDKDNWTKIMDVTMNKTTANTPESLDCDAVAAADYKGPFYLRVRIDGTTSANGTELEEGSEKLPMLTANDAMYPSSNSYDTRDAYYEDDWAFVYFEIRKYDE